MVSRSRSMRHFLGHWDAHAHQDYADYNDLAPVLHCFYEALRLYRLSPFSPPSRYNTDRKLLAAVTNLIRINTRDVSWTIPHMTPTNDPVFLPAGTEFVLDVIGACRNPHDYTNPESFCPLRWESEAALDAFPGFSLGPRGCLGRKFSTVEATCFLSHALRDWKFEVKLREGESPRQWQERMMQPMIGVTLKFGELLLGS